MGSSTTTRVRGRRDDGDGRRGRSRAARASRARRSARASRVVAAAGALGVLAPLVPAATGGAGAAAMLPPAGGGLSSLRQATVDRARAALTHPRHYRLRPGGVTRRSVPVGGRHPHNTLGRNGSNANVNQYTGYRAEDWCGDFVAATWTGHDAPDASRYPRLPSRYASSQAWRTGSGSRYHAFSRRRLPVPGDVLVWQDDDAAWRGHVGLVVHVDHDSRRVRTIEGNVDGEDVARKGYAWTRAGLAHKGLHVTGFVSRE